MGHENDIEVILFSMLQIIHRCEEGGIKRISVKVKREEHLGGEKFWGEKRGEM